MLNRELIEVAASVLRPRQVQDRWFGDVGAAVWSERGTVFTGVSVDTPSWGLCAERSALAAMITTGEYRFAKVVAVWRDPASGRLHVLPPCGVCREFMRAIDEANLAAAIVLSGERTSSLAALLPAHLWPEPLSLL